MELEELTEMDNQEDDFAPFTSKVHALTLMLLHSPRPIVSNMVCICIGFLVLDDVLEFIYIIYPIENCTTLNAGTKIFHL